MFEFYREALFDYKSQLKLDNVKYEIISNYLSIQEKLKKDKKIIEQYINNLSKKAYYNGDEVSLKVLMDTKVHVQKNKILNEDLQQIKLLKYETKELEKSLNNHLDKASELQELLNNIKHMVSNNSYESFLNEKNFQNTLYETNYKAAKYILDEVKYKKKSYKKNRYSYIQRNILKTNSLSYTGITCFDKYNHEPNGIQVKAMVNRYFINALLILMFSHPIYRNYIKFKFDPDIIRDKYFCYLQRRHYVLPKYKSFYIRENLLFEKNHNKIIQSIKHLDTLKKIESLIGRNKLDFYIQQNIINIDFSKYYEANVLNLIKKFPELNPIREKIEHKSSRSNCSVSYLNNVFSQAKNERKQDLINILLYSSSFINYVSKYVKSDKYVNLSKNSNISNLEKLVVENPKYKKYVSELFNIKKMYSQKNLLSLLFDLEGKVIYQDNYWKSFTAKENKVIIPRQKSISVFYNVNDQKKTFFNNVFPGDGLLLGREFNKMSHLALDKLDIHLKEIYGDKKEIYELVIDYETSNNNNTGNSPYKKVYWPEDFKKISVHNENGILEFKMNNKKINIVYFGSIPPHFYTGVKGILLQIISPWIMVNDGKARLQKLNGRKSYSIEYRDIENAISKDSTTTLINVIRYFIENKLPIKFYMHIKNSLYSKPIYITLLNIDAVNIFIETLKKSDIEIEEQNPNISNLKHQKKLIEFIEFFTMEDIVDVD